MKITFLSTSHYPNDDRIFHNMAISLNKKGYECEIITSTSSLKKVESGIELNCFNGNDLSKKLKINRFNQLLNKSNPDIIICSQPLTIISARKFKSKTNKNVKIIYDITEWYPSKKNLYAKKQPSKTIAFIKLLVFNIFSTIFVDAFIFGEKYKSVPYRILFPFKPFEFISYYPKKEYIKNTPPRILNDNINLCYSGKISDEKGFENFINVISELHNKNSNLTINLKIIGWLENDEYQQKYDTLVDSISEYCNIKKYNKLSLEEYIQEISDTDIFLDLRADDFENQMCLPIKLFYFIALRRPVIYTDLKAIDKEVEINKFGYLVNPQKASDIADLILKYINNNNLYISHCNKAEKKFKSDYNWDKIEEKFIDFLNNIVK